MGQTSSQPLLKSYSRRKIQESFITPQPDKECQITGQNGCSDELESAEVRITKEAWKKQKRSRRADLAFRQMVNLFTCCRGKTRVKEFRVSQTDRDGTDVPNRCFCIAFLDELYTRGQLLGIGSFGFVFEGVRKADGLPVKFQISLVAIKYVTKKQAKAVMDMERLVPLEVALMKRVNSAPASPHIVQLIDWFDGPIEYAMVLERPHPCQDLREFCESQGGKLTEDQARSVMVQVVEALRTCHNRGVLHRDLKLSNLLIQTDTLQIKLIDFGCGAFLKDTPYEDLAGARLCLPPEVFLQKLYLALPATVWSVGVTLFRIVCGSMPFRTEEAIIGVHLYFPNRVSTECRRLVRWCLCRNPADRPTLDQIMVHPWFQCGCRDIHSLSASETNESNLQNSTKYRINGGFLEG
ncbi:hypothetical protein GN956_G14923 [Arapaima gigas]